MTTTATANAKTGKCQECKVALSIYQCPRCSRRTCSLACCKKHKSRTGCNGKRDRTTYKRLEHMNDATLQSDFFFLENVLTTVDGGKRLLKDVGARATGGPQSLVAKLSLKDDDDVKQDEEPAAKKQKATNDLPPKWRRLVEVAKERDITLLLMPPGMERHKSNSTHYQTKSEVINWKVEFLLSDGTKPPTKLVNNKISEDSKVVEEWDKLKDGGNDGLHFLLKKLPCPSNNPQYVEIDKEFTLKEALKGMTVIEYPTIHVARTADLEQFPRLIQEVEEKNAE